MHIRLANKTDIEQLVRMRWDFTNEYNDKKIDEDQYQDFFLECQSFLQEALSGDRWFIWVAEAEGRIISHIYIELITKVPRPGKKTSPFAYMTNVYTSPIHRGKGIGSRLLKELEEWSKTNKYEFIIVWPSDWSIEFYERSGYKLCKEPMELVIE
ncbi:N-acetyltransferase family protein [Paenibacillus solani]|uniref:GNAT family N-acetyltransferase n=1 Tax=Paenibacillus solani TaxID=1705565 RepID=UPI003D2DF450